MSYSAYGTMACAPALKWPAAGPLQMPDDVLDYTYDAVAETQSGADPLVSVAVSVMPSGSGETVPSRVIVANGFNVTVWMTGGVAGRIYTVRLDLTTAAGRTKEVLIAFPIDPTLATFPLTPAPTPAFGNTLTWTANGVLAADGGYLTLTTLGTWPTSSGGLLPGALYAASPVAPAFIFAVPGFGYVPGPPVSLNATTAAALLAMGAMPLPPADPHVVGQLWISGAAVCVSLG